MAGARHFARNALETGVVTVQARSQVWRMTESMWLERRCLAGLLADGSHLGREGQILGESRHRQAQCLSLDC